VVERYNTLEEVLVASRLREFPTNEGYNETYEHTPEHTATMALPMSPTI
jgi:hypothetical protein